MTRAAGLSVGTISRVLNNRGYISGKTREKFKLAIKIKQATEGFAEMYAAEISSPESLKNLQTVAPNAYKVFRRMVTALEKKMRKEE